MKKSILIIVVFFSIFFVSCSQKQETKKENFLEKMEKVRSSGKVLIVKTLRDDSCKRIEDMFGNHLIPDTYYFWFKGYTIRKKFSSHDVDFFENHKKIKINISIKSSGNIIGVPLEVVLFDYQGDPSQMMME